MDWTGPTARDDEAAHARGGLLGAWLQGKRGALLVLVLYLAVTVAMTWPIARTLDQATGLRGDYFNNIWNAWWVRDSIVEGHSPWFTDYLYYPDGLSLKRHTLSPVNSLAGALLGAFMGPHASFNVLLLLKFAFSAWCFFFFARYVTGSTAGAMLGGLVYSFNPFHYYYLCQINVFSFEFVPLALLFFLKTYREGGWRNALWAALATGGIAATAEYYVAYTAIAVGLLLVLGRLVEPGVPWRTGALRLLRAGLPTVAVVVVVSLPLLLGTLGAEGATAEDTGLQAQRTNDLLGYSWISSPEETLVSWPTMIGYTTLLLLAVSWRRLWRQRLWLLVAAFFFVFGLGETLLVGGKDTGIPMPYGLLSELPVLSMLRKADRSYMMIQLVVALFCAEAWIGLADRLRGGRARVLAWSGCAALMMVELTGAPFRRFDYEAPAYYRQLAADPSVETILELPPMDIDTANARYDFFQVTHRKKEPLGYCTTLARSQKNIERMQDVVNSYVRFFKWNDASPVADWARANGIDLVVHHKTMPYDRSNAGSTQGVDEAIDGRTVWVPFFFIRRHLVAGRQIGKYVDQELPKATLWSFRRLLGDALGQPIHEDDQLMVFRVNGE